MAPLKAVVPIAGLGTRFLPLSKILPKELWPLIDKPIIQYIVEEAELSGIKQVVFVSRPEKKIVLDYFKKYVGCSHALEKILRSRKKRGSLQELKKLENVCKKISFSYVTQKAPLGDGQAILQAESQVQKKPFAVLFGDDVVASRTPCLLQLIRVFKKHKKPVLALAAVPKEKLFSYGVVQVKPVRELSVFNGVKKIKNRLYQIKDIVEKPKAGKAPSNLAVVGKYVLTPEIFNHLRGKSRNIKKEIILADALREMIKAGKPVLGLQFEGKWLECGNKLEYLKSNLYLSLKHKEFGKKLRKYIKLET